ncbi:hypothetical protein CAEBREN_11813 [Caenorhabditis brenneri]|uniref:Uncharacterized protein n=1 Tax=Caenorhabditis brenneri TaxID=135651 RepID=G0MCN4_CAEBE|nr:hypothetical protein CAEBREN_11813 [Caenorhabditis brenneri]
MGIPKFRFIESSTCCSSHQIEKRGSVCGSTTRCNLVVPKNYGNKTIRYFAA